MRRDNNIVVREAQESDVRQYFDWANDSEVRQMAFNMNPITWDNHIEWFKEKLSSQKSHLTICFIGEKAVGQVRFDEMVSGDFEIDISVDKVFRGQGIGYEMLMKAIDYVFLKYSIASFISEVKSTNIPSQRLFVSAGFQLQNDKDQIKTYKFFKKK